MNVRRTSPLSKSGLPAFHRVQTGTDCRDRIAMDRAEARKNGSPAQSPPSRKKRGKGGATCTGSEETHPFAKDAKGWATRIDSGCVGKFKGDPPANLLSVYFSPLLGLTLCFQDLKLRGVLRLSLLWLSGGHLAGGIPESFLPESIARFWDSSFVGGGLAGAAGAVLRGGQLESYFAGYE